MRRIAVLLTALSGLLAVISCDKNGEDGAPYMTLFGQEEYTKQYLADTYVHLGDFIHTQLEIEGRICNGNFSDMDPHSYSIGVLWDQAYKVIDECAIALTFITPSGLANDSFYNGQFTAIRGIIAYELASLWGHAWFNTEPINYGEKRATLDANALLESARDDLRYAADRSMNAPEGYIDRALAMTFHAIVELTRGDPDGAQVDLYAVNQIAGENGVSFSIHYADQFTGDQKILEVFNSKIYQLLYDEAYGNLGNLNQSWIDSGMTFGYWQMLTRTKMAPPVTWCQHFQMLFPIPSNVINVDPDMTQNPGY